VVKGDSAKPWDPKIEIIVPVYNARSSLSTCFSSLQNQVCQDVSILLVDDGSTDGSAELCDAFEARTEHVRVLHVPHGGLVAARKAGVRASRAEYVMFVDADDWIEPDMCQRMLEIVMAMGADLVLGGHTKDEGKHSAPQLCCLADGFYDRARIEQEIFPILFHDDFEDVWSIYPYLCGKLFRRSLLMTWLEHVDDNIRLGEDVCVTFPCIVHCCSLVVAWHPWYHYVQHASSMSHERQDGAASLASYRRIFQIVRASMQGLPQEAELLRQLRRYLLTTILLPRSPELLDGWRGMSMLFPFQDVPVGSRVILYGAGIFGMACYRAMTSSRAAEVVLWLDARAVSLRQQGWKVCSLSEMEAWPTSYDFVLVALLKTSTASRVCCDLVAAGVPEDKIRCLDKMKATSDASWKLFQIEV